MKPNITITALSLALAAVLSSPVSAAEATPANADNILRAMSAKLAAAKQFSYHAQREIDPALLEGRDVAEKARVDVSVSRPNQFAARSASKERTMRFVADGRTLTVCNETKNHYAQVPMRTSLDGLVTRLDEVYGFTPALAEFALGIPHAERNGHHYFAGLSQFPPAIQRAAQAAHADLYEPHADGFPVPRIRAGCTAIGSVIAAPFGLAFEPDLSACIPLGTWSPASLDVEL